MSLEIIQKPQDNIISALNIFSFGHNPVVIKVLRKDFTIENVQSDTISGTDYLKIELNAAHSILVGDQVYISGTYVIPPIAFVEGVFDVLAVDGVDITIDVEWNADFDPMTGFVNTISDLKREALVTGQVWTDDIGSGITYVPRKFSFDKFGVVTIYMNSILNDYYAKRYEIFGNYVSAGALRFSANIEDIQTSEDVNVTGLFGVKSVNQLGGKHLMTDYEVYATALGGGYYSSAKFLTAMEKPVAFQNYPFGLYALIGEMDWNLQINEGTIEKVIGEGYLYNFYAVNHSNLRLERVNIPNEAWRVPTDSDWKALEMNRGMSEAQADATGGRGTDEGAKLSGYFDAWTNGNLRNDANFGDSGFDSRPSGSRVTIGTFIEIENTCHFWTKTSSGIGAYIRRLTFDVTTIFRDVESKGVGVSVRLCRPALPFELTLADGSECNPYIGNDEKTYKTIKFGELVWLGENLAETLFWNTNTWQTQPISFVTQNSDWEEFGNVGKPAYCAYDNDLNNVGIFGEEVTYPLTTEKRGIYYFPISSTTIGTKQVFALETETEVQITETKEIIISKNCGGIYLKWENDFGGEDFYLFQGTEIQTFRASTEETYQAFLESIENETSNFQVLKKRYDEGIQAFARFDKVNAESFKQLARSKNVNLWLEGEWWQVDIEVSSYEVTSKSNLGKIAIRIILSKTYMK